MTIRIGCDPELFAYDKGRKQFISVHGILSGDKQHPVKVPRGAVQVDGTAAEFNIDPAETREQFLFNIHHVRKLLEGMVQSKNKDIVLIAKPSVRYPVEYFESLSFIEKELGCEPDVNAYTGEFNVKPNGDNTTLRTGAGHVHIQFLKDDKFYDNPYDRDHILDCCVLAKQLDVTLYRSSAVWDSDTERSTLYGKPGSFRPKKYGIEYRPLSNAWLNEEWTEAFVYDMTLKVTELFLDGINVTDKTVRDITLDLKGFCQDMKSLGLPSVLEYCPEGYATYKVA